MTQPWGKRSGEAQAVCSLPAAAACALSHVVWDEQASMRASAVKADESSAPRTQRGQPRQAGDMSSAGQQHATTRRIRCTHMLAHHRWLPTCAQRWARSSLRRCRQHSSCRPSRSAYAPTRCAPRQRTCGSSCRSCWRGTLRATTTVRAAAAAAAAAAPGPISTVSRATRACRRQCSCRAAGRTTSTPPAREVRWWRRGWRQQHALYVHAASAVRLLSVRAARACQHAVAAACPVCACGPGLQSPGRCSSAGRLARLC
jgi:hypothetical protein